MNLQMYILEQMDLVALRHLDEDSFQVETPPPDWFTTLWPAGFKRGPLQLRGVSHFLDNFMTDAGYHWAKHDAGSLKSGPFLEQLPDGGPTLPLEATALTTSEGTRILLIANLGESYEETLRILQAARENLLTQELLEIEVSKRTQEIRDREAEVATRLIYAAGFRDEETGAHIRRIGLYSAAMARALGWSQLAVDDIEIAAPMHDIGKIGIEDRILKKNGKLDDDEFAKMKRHAEIGEQMLSSSTVPMLKMAAEIAGAHHERWDGGGYPRGLSGEQIPMSARIVAIVDVYDALVHKRVYKPAYPEEEAINLMQDQAGKHFDPDLFQLFLAHLNEMRAIRQEVQDISEV